MPRPLKKKPAPKHDTPFDKPVCTDDYLEDWRNLVAHDKRLDTRARAIEPILRRLDAAEKYIVALENEPFDAQIPSHAAMNGRQAWYESKGEEEP